MYEALADRFWSKVDKTSFCWLWRAAKTGAGYGQIRITTGPGQSKAIYSHRISWELANGPIPEGLEVLHKCDNPPCVRPDHLFLGTQSDNENDSVSKGRWNHPKGEEHPKAILTYAQVEEIRKSTLSQRKLAKQYSVSRGAVQAILNGRNWRH
jgi:hypothetical protein